MALSATRSDGGGGGLRFILGALLGGGGESVSISSAVLSRLAEIGYTGPTLGQLTGPAPPPSPVAPPSFDLEPIPPAGPAPIAPPLPTLPAEVVAGVPPQLTPFPSSFGGQYRSESGTLAKAFDEAYGIRSGLRLRKARRMARRKRTMRAQQTVEEIFVPNMPPPIDPRQLPVPAGQVPTDEQFNRAIEEEARRRREATQPGRTIPPRRPPTAPRTADEPAPRRGRRGRVGVGVGGIIDPIGIAEDLAEISGAVVGEAIYGGGILSDEEAAARSRELATREQAEFEREVAAMDRDAREAAAAEMNRRAQQDADRAAAENERLMRQQGVGVSTRRAPPPAPRRRGQRLLSRVQQMTNNPWAMAGIFGLGLLGGRSRSRSQAAGLPLPIAPGDEFEDLPLPEVSPEISPGAVPFPFMGGGYSIPPTSSTSSCDCKPKRRGPKRRCLERAQVQWRSGRYKGKPAGTRCVRWE